MSNWIYSYSSVIGAGHAETGAPCQDSCVIKESDNGKWLAIVVSDGAGSAKHSEISSNFVTAFFSKSLISLSNELEKREPGFWVNDYVIDSILKVRNELRAVAKYDDLKNYHCTLVACLLSETGGFVIHIGDGAVFGGKSISNDAKSYYFSSLPENGEYSNETFFVTEGDWIKHLRITPINLADWIMLGTDGGTSLSMVNDKDPKWGFVVPLFEMIKKESNLENRNAKLKSILSDTQADKLTGDDKTICIAFRKTAVIDKDNIKLIESTDRNLNLNQIDKTDSQDDSVQQQTLNEVSSPVKCRLVKFAKYILLISLVGIILHISRFFYLYLKGFFS